MRRALSNFFFIILAIFPNAVKRLVYNKCFGCEIDSTARIGISFIRVTKIQMGPKARIGNFNVIKDLELLQLGIEASIGSANRISAMPLGSRKHFQSELDRFPALIIGDYSAITGKHYFDCNNTISIGHHSQVAGLGSMFFTHGINLNENRQESAIISIGNYCMIAARCVLVKGSQLPDCCVLAANSTLHKKFEKTHTLYSGVPAVALKGLDPSAEYFHREKGYVA